MGNMVVGTSLIIINVILGLQHLTWWTVAAVAAGWGLFVMGLIDYDRR